MPQRAEIQRSRRTPKACDVCRHKKIKCNGEMPCQNCSAHVAVCTYNFVSMRKKVNDAYSKNSTAKLKDIGTSVSSNSNIDVAKDRVSADSLIVPKEAAASVVPESYSLRPRKVKASNDSHVSKRNTHQQLKKSDKDFESRLNKMESMMEFIVNKLSDNTYKPAPSKDSSRSSNSYPSSPSIFDGSDGKDDGSLNGDSDVRKRINNNCSKTPPVVNNLDTRSTLMNITPLSTDSTMSLQEKVSLLEDQKKTSGELEEEIQDIVTKSETYKKQHFFFPHLSFSLFSGIGVRWLGSRLKSAENLIGLKRLISTAVLSEQDLAASWSENIDKSRLSPFPSRGTTFSILHFMEFIMSQYTFHRVKKFFEDYYDGQEGLTPVREFKKSESLLMNTSLLMSIVIASEAQELEGRDNFKREELESMQNAYFTNALYYLHFCTIVNEDLNSIESITQLAWYADLIQMPQVSFMLTSIAIRQVQAMNMNRKEIYNKDSEENEFKMRLFWQCYILDKEVSMKTGKPPILNDFDITTPAPASFRHCWSLNPDPMTGIHPRDTKGELIGDYLSQALAADDPDLRDFTLYMDLELSAIVSRSHCVLFHATAFLGKTEDQVYSKITSLLHDLESFRLAIPSSVRPPTDLDFSFLDKLSKIKEESGTPHKKKEVRLFHLLLTFYLRFYYIQLSICNVLMNCNWYRDYQGFKSEKVSEKELSKIRGLEKLGLHAARAILIVARLIDARSIYGSNYCLYFPFSGFITLFSNCMHSPTNESIADDVQLLIESTRTYFTRFYVGNQHFEEKWNLVRGAIKFLLYLVVTTVSEQKNIQFDVSDIFDGTSYFHQHNSNELANRSANDNVNTGNNYNASMGTNSGDNPQDPNKVGSLAGTPNSYPPQMQYSSVNDYSSYKEGISPAIPIAPNSRGFASDMLPLGSSANNSGLSGLPINGYLNSSAVGDFKTSMTSPEAVIVNNESQLNMQPATAQAEPFDSFSYLDSYLGDMALQSFFNMPQALLDLDQSSNNINYYANGNGIGPNANNKQ